MRKDEPRARVAALTVPGRAFRRADAWRIWFGEGWEVRRDDGMRLSRQTLEFCDEALQNNLVDTFLFENVSMCACLW